MATQFAPAYLANESCKAFEDVKARLYEEWTRRTDRSPAADMALRRQHEDTLEKAAWERDVALQAQGLYVAERWGELDWEVELLPRDESEVA